LVVVGVQVLGVEPVTLGWNFSQNFYPVATGSTPMPVFKGSFGTVGGRGCGRVVAQGAWGRVGGRAVAAQGAWGRVGGRAVVAQGAWGRVGGRAVAAQGAWGRVGGRAVVAQGAWGRTCDIGVELFAKLLPRCNRFYPNGAFMGSFRALGRLSNICSFCYPITNWCAIV
jgi:hypothetical protein